MSRSNASLNPSPSNGAGWWYSQGPGFGIGITGNSRGRRADEAHKTSIGVRLTVGLFIFWGKGGFL